MKKMFLTMVLAVGTLFAATAQDFTVVSSYAAPDEGESYSLESFTNNLGVMYACTDTWSAGFVKNGEEYDLLARYNYSDNIYISLQAPTEETFDNLSIGLGYSLNVWKSLNVEPNYTMDANADDDGERNGSFNLGLSYRF
jgi:opacity protein-like surface antigen